MRRSAPFGPCEATDEEPAADTTDRPPLPTKLPPGCRNSPKLLQSLKEKGSFLKSQFTQLQKNITGLRFSRQRKDLTASQSVSECADVKRSDQKEALTRGECSQEYSEECSQRVPCEFSEGVDVSVCSDSDCARCVPSDSGKAGEEDGRCVCVDPHCQSGRQATMTKRGQACMEHTQASAASRSSGACNGHHSSSEHRHLQGNGQSQHHSEDDLHRGHRPRSGSKRSSVSSGPRFRSVSEVTEPDDTVSHSEDSRILETDDELPLGSEANSLRHDTEGEHGDGLHGQPPVDKRLLWLRQGGGLPGSGWTSFNSDASNLTSGSSANSVDWLLQERQVDPEEVLRNLGFGGGPVQDPASMYTRIPVRFLEQQAQDAAQPDDPEVAGQEVAGEGGRRNPSRAQTAWRTARTMSSAMLSLKLLSSLQQSPPLGVLGSMPLASGSLGRSPLSGSSPCLTPPGSGAPRSVLSLENQRALARQGFYGDSLPEGIEQEFMHRERGGGDEDDARTRRSAEDRRKMFQKTRSKRQKSLVESGEEEEHGVPFSGDSIMQSVDFSTTTESTDSGELLSSAPTTPGDVFMENQRIPSPNPSGPVFPGSVTDIEKLYFPERERHNSSLTDNRKKITQKLMEDLDNDDNYFVSPQGSRQPTVEKAATLTETQAQNTERDLSGKGTPLFSPSKNAKSDLGGKNVTIVVSTNEQMRKTSAPNTSKSTGMNFLSIVNAAMDRSSDKSSDCGSDYTLVEQLSSASGSESPRPSNSGGEEQRQDVKSPQGFADLEEGPMVYHKNCSGDVSPRDENDNFKDTGQSQADKAPLNRVGNQQYDDDLPRMSSIQSDSSGIGESEVSGENAAQEMAYLKVNSLGSSCESSTTQASTRTVTPGDSFQWSQQDSLSQQTPSNLHSDLDDNQDSGSSERQVRSGQSESETGSGRRYVSSYYILVNNAKSPATTTVSRTHSGRPATSPRDFVLGKTKISLVLRENGSQQPGTDIDRRDGRRVGAGLETNFVSRPASAGLETKFVSKSAPFNEKPLSEELALASMQGNLHSSTPRYTVSQSSTSTVVPKLMLQRPSMDTVGQDETRSSGDELEDDSRSPFSPWGRDLPRSGASHRFAALREEEGDVGSGASAEESSVYSYASTADSVNSSTSSDVLDCHKLIKLINQPTMFKGRMTHLVRYRPKRHLREWPNLVKKKKLQEETRLAQYAVQKFKTELSIMETAVMVKYQMAFEEMSQEEREDVEELQHLWAEVRRQVMETEQLLTSRMKAIASGNDNFNSLTSISVLQRMIDILKEQMFQRQISITQDERDVEEGDYGWMDERMVEPLPYSPYSPAPYSPYSPQYSSNSWADLPRPPRVRGRYSSSASTSHLAMMSPSYSDRSFEQLRRGLMSDVRQELSSSLQKLQDDLQKRDREIQHLQEQLMETRIRRPRSARSRSYQSPRQRNVFRKETDV